MLNAQKERTSILNEMHQCYPDINALKAWVKVIESPAFFLKYYIMHCQDCSSSFLGEIVNRQCIRDERRRGQQTHSKRS